jgi:ATP-dependent Lhr-like helicase
LANQLNEITVQPTNETLEARQNIVRRALRYRGAMDVAQVAERYFWSKDEAHAVLEFLLEQGSAIVEADLYYHAELYERARRATISERRQVQTMPSSHFAALMAGCIRTLAPPEEQLKQAIEKLTDRPFPANQWETQLLPTRVNGYRPELLDRLLASGEVFWHLSNDGLSFHSYADVDWDADTDAIALRHCGLNPQSPNQEAAEIQGIAGQARNDVLTPDEQSVMQFLQKRGASFISAFAAGKDEAEMQEILFSLMEKGLVHADSFTPIRIWLERDKIEKYIGRRKLAMQTAAAKSGRWDIRRPLKPRSVEEKLNRAFDKIGLLSRETAASLLDISWSAALEHLRVWEYTGRVWRGYFVEGLSGAQYIRENAYISVRHELEHPADKIVWLAATDPNQVWGKILSYDPEKQFTSVPGTAVALKKGIPVAVFERKGHTLRIFDENILTETLIVFSEAFKKRNIFPALHRITVKQFPETATQALSDAGFMRVMLDYVLYR